MGKKSKKAPKHYDPQIDAINREYVYAQILPLALNTMAHGFQSKNNEAHYYEECNRMEALKNSLPDLLLKSIPKNTILYQKRMATKILLEKLILDIYSNARKSIKEDIAKIVLQEGLVIAEKYQIPLKKEEKMLIRSDFDGNIYSQSKEDFSPTYKKLLSRKNTHIRKKYTQEDYDLQKIPAWQGFAQFRNFRRLEKKLCQTLANMQISPKTLLRMNAFDIADILRNNCRNENGKIFEGSRTKFIKYFIQNHESAFREYMLANQSAISEIMYRKGMQLPYNSPETYVAYIEESIHKMKKNGSLPPIFNIHHKISVQDGRQKNNLSEVNDMQNLCVILDSPYHVLIHTLSQNYTNEGYNFYNLCKRVEIPDNIIFFGGLDKSSQIQASFPPAQNIMLKQQKGFQR